MLSQELKQKQKKNNGNGWRHEVPEKHPHMATEGDTVSQQPRHTTEHQKRMTQIDEHGCLRKTGGEKACKHAFMQGDKITNRHNAEGEE